MQQTNSNNAYYLKTILYQHNGFIVGMPISYSHFPLQTSLDNKILNFHFQKNKNQLIVKISKSGNQKIEFCSKICLSKNDIQLMIGSIPKEQKICNSIFQKMTISAHGSLVRQFLLITVNELRNISKILKSFFKKIALSYYRINFQFLDFNQISKIDTLITIKHTKIISFIHNSKKINIVFGFEQKNKFS